MSFQMNNTSSFFEKMNEKLAPIATKLGNQRHLRAVSEGMFFSLPFMVIGAFFLIVANPPINMDTYDPATANFLVQGLAAWKNWATANYDLITAPYNLTFGIIGLISAFGIAYSLAGEYRLNKPTTGMISAVAFLLVCTSVTDGSISLSNLGANGLFVAIIIGLIAPEIGRAFEERDIKISLPDSVPPMVGVFINSLLPLLVNIIVFYGLNLVLIALTGKNLPDAVMGVLTPSLDIAGSLWGFILVVLIGQVLWLFGINGSSIIFPIVFTLGVAQTGLNAEQFAAGETMTHLMNLQMYRISVMGGAGNTLGLVILMMMSRAPQFKTIGRLALIPGICSINEPVIFGLPIVFNPILGIPFIIAPVVSLLLTYLAQAAGIISLGYIVDPSFTPFFAQAFLCGMDWRNVVFWLALIPVSMAIYYPFFKVYERSVLAAEGEADQIEEKVRTATDNA